MKFVFALLILVSFSIQAEEYTAPDIKLGLHPHSEPTVKGETKWDEGSFKVQEKQEKDRALASEDEEDNSTMLGRNPSSKKGVLEPEFQYWKWNE